MQKLYKGIVLFGLLIFMPAFSYYYLTKGIDFRKQMIKELASKEKMAFAIKTSKNEDLSFKGKCTVIDVNADEQDLKNIYLQFKEGKGFQLLSKIDEIKLREFIDIRDQVKKDQILKNSFKNPDSISYEKIKANFKNETFIIVDSLANIRHRYKNTFEDKKKLIGHITALLPYYDEKKGR